MVYQEEAEPRSAAIGGCRSVGRGTHKIKFDCRWRDLQSKFQYLMKASGTGKTNKAV